MANVKQTDILTGSIPKQLLAFFMPIWFGTLFQQLYNTADTLIVGGTSLVVYPAAGLTRYFTGDTLAICNLAPTDQDANADLLISCDIAAAFAF